MYIMIHLQNYLIDQQIYNLVSLVKNHVIWKTSW
jgi:hypothetical protein